MSDQHVHHHAHTHHHHGPPGDASGSYAEQNRSHFDKTAHQYDDIPFAKELTEKIGKVIIEEYAFDKDNTCVMEFACGTGLVSKELLPHTKQIVGVDISQGMVDQYNSRATKLGVPAEKMHAIREELKGVDDSELGSQKFDLIICTMAYHHFENVNDITRMLAFFLKPGATLLVVDFIKADEGIAEVMGVKEEELKQVVAHRAGVGEPAMRAAFEGASLQDYSLRPAASIEIEGKKMEVFVAKGWKAA